MAMVRFDNIMKMLLLTPYILLFLFNTYTNGHSMDSQWTGHHFDTKLGWVHWNDIGSKNRIVYGVSLNKRLAFYGHFLLTLTHAKIAKKTSRTRNIFILIFCKMPIKVVWNYSQYMQKKSDIFLGGGLKIALFPHFGLIFTDQNKYIKGVGWLFFSHSWQKCDFIC